MAASETERLVRRFVDRTLPKSEWTHFAHLRVGLWHVREHGPDEALRLLRMRIRAYNETIGVANTDTSGYHETITRFYVQVIHAFLAQAEGAAHLDELAQRLIQQCGDRQLPLEFYSRQRLESARARAKWLEPDLRPLAQRSSADSAANA